MYVHVKKKCVGVPLPQACGGKGELVIYVSGLFASRQLFLGELAKNEGKKEKKEKREKKS